MKKISIIFCAVVLIIIVYLDYVDEKGQMPNIIIVMADDLGWSDIGCYGGEIQTPNIDLLAEEGLRFSQFYNNALCGPTRASILTGLYSQQVGHRGDHWNDLIDFTKCATIAEVLQQAGYHTMLVGKWQQPDSPLDRGFDRFFGPMSQDKISYYHEVAGNPFYLNRERFVLPKDFYLTDALNEFAIKFLDESIRENEPFFLYVSHIAPHWPLHAKEEEIAVYRKQYKTLGWDESRLWRFQRQREIGIIPENWDMSLRPTTIHTWQIDRNKEWQAERMAVYAAQVGGIDKGVGRLLRFIEDAGKSENTLVIFLSDNGAAPDGGLVPTTEGLGFGPSKNNKGWRKDGVPIRPGSGPDNPPGPHDTFAAYGSAWANVSNTPFRGSKLTGYEGGIRTPLVVRWPAVIRKGGGITKRVGHVVDLMATFVDIADTDYPIELNDRKPLPLEGKSLLPVFRNSINNEHNLLCWSVPQHQVIRMNEWKAIRAKNNGSWQLFNLEVDGTETTDLASHQPDLLKKMINIFQNWRRRVGAL